jgi:hypothetical protein
MKRFGKILNLAMAGCVILGILSGLVCAYAYAAAAHRNDVYTYESSDRGMHDSEMFFKRRELREVEASFEQYKKEKGDASLFLCRTSKMSWKNPINWLDNFTNRRWKLPYMEPSPNL